MYNINYSFYCHAPKTQKNKKKQTNFTSEAIEQMQQNES